MKNHGMVPRHFARLWIAAAVTLALSFSMAGCGTVRIDGDDDDAFSFSLFADPYYDVFYDDVEYVEYVDVPADVYIEDVYYDDVYYDDFWGDAFYFDFYDGWYDDWGFYYEDYY